MFLVNIHLWENKTTKYSSEDQMFFRTVKTTARQMNMKHRKYFYHLSLHKAYSVIQGHRKGAQTDSMDTL